MSYLNKYTAPEPLPLGLYHATTPLEAYDLNFNLAIPTRALSTPGGVNLYPLIPSLHARRLYELYRPHPESFKWLPYGPFDTFEQFLTFVELVVRTDPATLLFVVYDMSLEFDVDDGDDDEEDLDREGGAGLRQERIAGIVGVLKSVPKNRSIEIGHLHIPPPFQRTHVLTHSIALLLSWLLDAPPSPSSSTPRSSSLLAPVSSSLGLRRVQWYANELNRPSIAAAERIGFHLETTSSSLRWERVTRPDKDGIDVSELKFLTAAAQGGESERKDVERKRGGGRHSTVLSIDWERWYDGGVKDRVERSVRERPVRTRNFAEVKFEPKESSELKD